jgi:hypothetical protein
MLWHRCHCNGTGRVTGATGFDRISNFDSGDRSVYCDRKSVHYSIGKKLKLCKVLKVRVQRRTSHQ